MARARTASPPAEPPTEEEQERLAAEEKERDSEVRPEEFELGTDTPIVTSAFPPELVDALREKLDSNRVRRREGRGSERYEYLAVHDVKRRANELFGFGNWGHRIVSQVEIGAVEVKSKNGREGWHVAYRCVVEVWVQIGNTRSYLTQGSGYGDGVEYTPAARLQACELALKESESDALKRAFVDLGDQFGLILYAKQDERKKIERDLNTKDTESAVVRDNETRPPRSWPEIGKAYDTLLGNKDEREWWLAEAVESFFQKPKGELTRPELELAGQKVVTAYLELVDGEPELDPFGYPTRAALQKAFSMAFDGLQLDGPPWRLGAETDKPTREEWLKANAEPAAAADDDDVPFGET